MPSPMTPRISVWMLLLVAMAVSMPLLIAAPAIMGVSIPVIATVHVMALLGSLAVLSVGLLVAESMDHARAREWRARAGSIAHPALVLLWLAVSIASVGSGLVWPAVSAAILHALAAAIDIRIAAELRNEAIDDVSASKLLPSRQRP